MLPPVLAAKAAQQRGCFTRAQGRSCGLDDVAVARALRRTEWHQLGRGVYVETELWSALDGDDQHLCQTQARLLVLGTSWGAARRTAVVAHGLRFLGQRPQVPQLVGDKAKAKARDRHERVASLPARDLMTVEGLQVTTKERLVIDVARREDLRSAVVIADSALREGADRDVLLAVAQRCRGWPGARSVPAVLELADARAESAFESISRVAFHLCGLPMPEPQVKIYLGKVLLARVDWFWREFNLVGESDGRVKYTEVDDFYREKIRGESLTGPGLELVRWDWNLAWRDHAELRSRIELAMAQGLTKQLDPRLRFVTMDPVTLRSVA